MADQVKSSNKPSTDAAMRQIASIGKPKQPTQTGLDTQLNIEVVIELVHEPMVVLDSDLRVIYANRSFYREFNMAPKEIEGQIIFDLSDLYLEMTKLREFLEKILPKTNKYYEFELEYKSPSGDNGVFELNGQRVTIGPNGQQMILLAIKNITGQYKLLEESEESYSIIRETLESTDDGILVFDIKDMKIKVSNHRFVELFDIPEHIMASGDYDEVLKFIIEQLTEPKRFVTIADELNKNKSAESFDIIETNKKKILEFYSKPQRIVDEIVGRVWSFRDITSRKWAENALKITYESFYNILKSSKDGIIVVDKKGSICFFNQAAEAMIPDKINEQLNENLGFKIIAGEIKEITIERLEGGQGVAEMRVVEAEWEGKDAYLAMLRDITDRKSAEEELRKHQEDLEEKVKQRTNELIQAEKMVALGQLVSGVAHEVNNPLAFIRSNTEFMKDVLFDLMEQMKEQNLNLESLEEINELIKVNQEGINRISSITTALKRFAKPGSGEKSFSDINQGIMDTLLIVGNKLKHRITLHEDYAELPEVLCNIEQLNQVFMNIILNASEAMDDGNLYIRTGVEKKQVLIEFRDDGKGIPEDEKNKIFDPFFTTKDSGTGLGLSLSYRIIQAHEGNIKVDSKLGEGTKITIEIPIIEQKK